jgi:integrase
VPLKRARDLFQPNVETRLASLAAAKPDWALEHLDRHLREHGPFFELNGYPSSEPLLFRGGRGNALHRKVAYKPAWKPALKAAGLPEDRYVFHSLRHWCASSMLSHPRGSLPAVADHLGDTVETVMRTYVHWLRDQDGHAGGLLDDVRSSRVA